MTGNAQAQGNDTHYPIFFLMSFSCVFPRRKNARFCKINWYFSIENTHKEKITHKRTDISTYNPNFDFGAVYTNTTIDVISLSLYQSLYLASKQGAGLEHQVPGVLLDGWSWLLQEAIDPSWRGSISTPGARPWTCWTHGRWQSPAARSRGDLQLCWWSRSTLHNIVVDVNWPIISLKSENVHNWKRKWVRSVL